MIRIPTRRSPTHPDEMLQAEFLLPLGLTQRELADTLRIPYRKINELVNGHRSIIPAIALRLAKYFGVSADCWINLQLRWDLYQAGKDEAETLSQIRPYVAG